MQDTKSWIYMDNNDNTWKFSVNNNYELQYTIMDSEGICTKEKLVVKDVTGLYIYTNGDGIHIIYSDLNSEIKYCTFLEQQWMGKTLYKFNADEIETKDIKVVKLGGKIHIFCVLKHIISNDHGIIMHCIWDGNEINIVKQQDVILPMGFNEYYLVYLDEKTNIDLLFISDEGNEISLNLCSYKDNKWESAKRLYGISGDEFEFSIISDRLGIHLLNKYKKDSDYYLEHVLVKSNGEFLNITIYESIKQIIEIILVKVYNKIYCYWLDDNKIYYSAFDELLWSAPKCINDTESDKIMKYNFCTEKKGDFNIDREVYGVEESNFRLILPSKFVNNEIETDKNKEHKQEALIEGQINNSIHQIEHLNTELSRIKTDNSILMQTIETLNLELQNQQKKLLLYDEKDSFDVDFKKMQIELDQIYKQLEEEKGYKQEVIERLKSLEEELGYKQEVIEKLKGLEKELNFIKIETQKLIEDNIKLNKALEIGKNFIL